MAEALGQKAGRKVELALPQRGERRELVLNAERNARESLARRMSESATQARLLEGLAEAFGLDAALPHAHANPAEQQISASAWSRMPSR